jgi:SAM-dependent methyltransferase
MDPKRIVEDGYDRIGERYREWSAAGSGGQVRRWFLGEVLARVPVGARVLELGCGPGVDAVALAEGRTYTGVDLSSVMLAAARGRVPSGSFLKGDLLSVEPEPSVFDAVVALYVFGHLPGEEHRVAIGRAFTWLAPGGVFCASFPTGADPGMVQQDFIGVPMFFGGIGRAETEEALGRAGFGIELSEEKQQEEDGATASFLWVVARKPLA